MLDAKERTLPLLCTRRTSPQNWSYSTVVIPIMARYYLKEITSEILSAVIVGFRLTIGWEVF